MNLNSLTGQSGVVTVDVVDEKGQPSTMKYTITPLSQAEELLLYADLKKQADSKRRGDMLKRLEDLGAVENPTWAHRQVVSEITAIITGEVTKWEIELARTTVEGVRSELYFRARKSMPTLTPDGVRMCVTEATCLSIREQIDAILNPPKDDTKSAAA